MSDAAKGASAETLLRAAKGFEKKGAAEKAERCYRLVLASQSNLSPGLAYIEYSRFLENAGRLREASSLLAELLMSRAGGFPVQVYLSMGRICGKLGQFRRGTESLNRAIAAAPDSAEPWIEMARLAERAGWLAKMTRAIETARTIDPRAAAALGARKDRSSGRGRSSLQVFGLGLGRSGTNSLVRVFEKHGAEKDFMRDELADCFSRFRSGAISGSDFDRFLILRDKRRDFALDECFLHGFYPDRLARIFPESKFILLLRDCYSWTESTLNHNLNRSAHRRRTSAEPWLSVEGIDPSNAIQRFVRNRKSVAENLPAILDVLLPLWADTTAKCINALEPERLLVVRTHELSRQIPKIAEFTGTHISTLQESHENKAVRRHCFFTNSNRLLLKEKFRRICGPLMKQHFPEFRLETYLGRP